MIVISTHQSELFLIVSQLIRPRAYLQFQILILQYAEVTAQVLNAISEISVIGGAEIVKNLKPLFEKLTHMINDSSSLHKREVISHCYKEL